jgi:hypothetical protein
VSVVVDVSVDGDGDGDEKVRNGLSKRPIFRDLGGANRSVRTRARVRTALAILGTQLPLASVIASPTRCVLGDAEAEVIRGHLLNHPKIATLPPIAPSSHCRSTDTAVVASARTVIDAAEPTHELAEPTPRT